MDLEPSARNEDVALIKKEMNETISLLKDIRDKIVEILNSKECSNNSDNSKQVKRENGKDPGSRCPDD
jgi:hypothetical protein